MTKEEALKRAKGYLTDYLPIEDSGELDEIMEALEQEPVVLEQEPYIEPLERLKVSEQEPKWIPVSEGLPEDLEAVNITWVNHNPESYYMDIKDKPFTATGHYCKGRWYWYSSTCQDYLKEYGRCDVDEIDADIEVTAWQPLPQPYKAESES